MSNPQAGSVQPGSLPLIGLRQLNQSSRWGNPLEAQLYLEALEAQLALAHPEALEAQLAPDHLVHPEALVAPLAPVVLEAPAHPEALQAMVADRGCLRGRGSRVLLVRVGTVQANRHLADYRSYRAVRQGVPPFRIVKVPRSRFRGVWFLKNMFPRNKTVCVLPSALLLNSKSKGP